MIDVQVSAEAPPISFEINDLIKEINDIENYVLSLQLDYKDHNTLFYLDKVTNINFTKDMLQIKQKNNSTAFFDYNNILEYCVINARDVLDLEGV